MQKIVYLAFILLPILSLQVVRGVNLIISDIVFLGLLFIMLLKGKISKTKINKLYYSLFFLYFLSGITSIYKAKSTSTAIIGIFQHLFTFIGLFTLLNKYIDKRRVLENCMKIMIFMGVVSVAYTLFFDTATVHGRYFSFMNSLSVYGLYLTSIIPFIFYFFYYSTRKLLKVYYIISLSIILYGVILSGSRSGILVSIVVLFLLIQYYLISTIKKFELRLMINIFLIIGIIISIWNYDLILINLMEFISPIQPNLAQKLSTLYATNLSEIDIARAENILSFFDNIDKYAVIGIGFNNFYMVTGGISLHTFLLAIWAELGLIAFVSIVILIVYLMLKLFNYSRSIKNDSIYFTFLVSNIGAFIFMSLNPLYSHRVTWIFFILGYLVLAMKEKGLITLNNN